MKQYQISLDPAKMRYYGIGFKEISDAVKNSNAEKGGRSLELAEKENIEVILIGGKLSRNTNIVTGSQVINELSDLRVDLCLLGTNSLSLDEGITDSDWEVVQIKRAMIKSSKTLAILSITEKLNSNQKMRVAPLRDVTYLVTDLNANHPKLKEFANFVKIV